MAVGSSWQWFAAVSRYRVYVIDLKLPKQRSCSTDAPAIHDMTPGNITASAGRGASPESATATATWCVSAGATPDQLTKVPFLNTISSDPFGETAGFSA